MEYRLSETPRIGTLSWCGGPASGLACMPCICVIRSRVFPRCRKKHHFDEDFGHTQPEQPLPLPQLLGVLDNLVNPAVQIGNGAVTSFDPDGPAIGTDPFEFAADKLACLQRLPEVYIRIG